MVAFITTFFFYTKIDKNTLGCYNVEKSKGVDIVFEYFRKKRIEKFTYKAIMYIVHNYEPEDKPIPPTDDEIKKEPPTETPKAHNSGVRYSISTRNDTDSKHGSGMALESNDNHDIRYSDRYHDKSNSLSDIKYSDRAPSELDKYDVELITEIMHDISPNSSAIDLLKRLDKTVNQTFSDRLAFLIRKSGMRDTQVYKAAQMDKRLFSKIMSDKNYKPSKDTVIALIFALELSLSEAEDLLSRAGYTLSHSNKRDVILEFFIRERIHNLFDVNEILYNLNQKTIGR